MNKNIILTVVGPDKPGIVSNISEIVKNCSGNIDKSRMVRLGDFFTIMVLVSIDENYLKQLENELNKDSNYKITIHESNNNLKESDENIHIIHLNGIDNEGLVYEVTNELAKLSIICLIVLVFLPHARYDYILLLPLLILSIKNFYYFCKTKNVVF